MNDIDEINEERQDLIKKKKKALNCLIPDSDLYLRTMYSFDKQILGKNNEIK